ncbi:hypothetical protein [Anabaena subtropica]|uniref:hypothetical protein n=1 Tax=Anabaena subtropica TaxID=425380 RepID=UPI001F55215D|nr:hypothetical protein [Anabaena subtropica]
MKPSFTYYLYKVTSKLNKYYKIFLKKRINRKSKSLLFLFAVIIGFLGTFIIIPIDLTLSKVPKNTYKTDWIGNTFTGANKWVQNYIEAMYVTPNGIIYTNSHWDEAGAEASIYKDGRVIGMLSDIHGWSRSGGKAVTADSKYIYIAMSQGSVGKIDKDYPPEGTTWYCVRRYDLSGKPAPFTGGIGWDKSMLLTSIKGEVTGLVTRDKNLYISDSGTNKIRVFNTDTMKELRNFSVARPGGIAIDKQGNLWIIQKKDANNPAKILRYSTSGKQLPQQITNVVVPEAIAVDNQGRLLVAENGPLQQVLIYSITDKPLQVDTFGSTGGIYGGIPGEVQDLKLYGLTGVGADTEGNLYINSNGFNNSRTDLRKFSPSGKQLWRLLGLSLEENADADPTTDGREIFTKYEHFLIDHSKPASQQWIYKAYTLNAFKYPQDPRLHTSPDTTFVRRINGQRFLFLLDMYTNSLQIYRFNPSKDGNIAIPAGMFISTNSESKQAISGTWPPYQPQTGEWIWRDRNGNGAFDQGEYDNGEDSSYVGGWWVDSKGDVWTTLRNQKGIHHYSLQGLDSNGNPIYTYSAMQKDKTPRIFTDLRRIKYFPESDTMYLSGFTAKHPATGDDPQTAGSEIARFDNWSQENRTLRWRILVPKDTIRKREIITAFMDVVEK